MKEKPNCKRHKNELIIDDPSCSLEIAEKLGDLRYDFLQEVLGDLANKLYNDGCKDDSAGRVNLADELFNAAGSVYNAERSISKAWEISKPYMS
tara:strand:- start:17344 stop:17625 length:282 start_codon:yes stop_codon:yes gene_type:complete